jgi:hypothetical protein
MASYVERLDQYLGSKYTRAAEFLRAPARARAFRVQSGEAFGFRRTEISERCSTDRHLVFRDVFSARIQLMFQHA